jgi:hypothetical protein
MFFADMIGNTGAVGRGESMRTDIVGRVGVAVSSALMVVAMAATAVPASASTAPASVPAAPSKPKPSWPAKPVTQTGIITASPVGGKETAFKVTDGDHTQVWVATAQTVVVKDGHQVPLTAVGMGDKVTVSGEIADDGRAQAEKVIDES